MFPARRTAVRAVRQTISRPSRRFESSSSSGHSSHDAHHHAAPVNEHLGRNFYLTLASLPVLFAFYKFSHNDPNSPPLFTRLIDKYSQYKERWIERNTLHTRMIEQAAFDRNLFQSEKGSKMIDLKFPEVFNVGSPINIPAGHNANLEAITAHYNKMHKETEERQQKRAAERKE